MPIHMVFMSSMEDAFIGRGNYNGSTGLQVDAFRIDRGGPVVNACRYGGGRLKNPFSESGTNAALDRNRIDKVSFPSCELLTEHSPPCCLSPRPSC